MTAAGGAGGTGGGRAGTSGRAGRAAGSGDVFRLDGNTAVVTGAASGIGQAVAVRLAGAGARVVAADVDESGLAETVKLVEKASGTAAVVAPTDVSQREEVDALLATALDACGRVDVVVNVAGVMRTAPLVDLTEDELDLVLAVNLKGALFGTQAAIRAMRDAGGGGRGGSVVNVASAALDAPAAGYGAYAISKAGVAMLTRTAAVEAGEHGIRVNAVSPGFVETGMTARWFTDDEGAVDTGARDALLGAVAKRSPLGATGGPDDVAWAVLYLASPASRYVTGQILRPNGGVAMPW